VPVSISGDPTMKQGLLAWQLSRYSG